MFTFRYRLSILNFKPLVLLHIDSRKHKFAFFFKKGCLTWAFTRFEFIAICETYLSFYHLWEVPQYIVAARWRQKSLPMNNWLCNLQFFDIFALVRNLSEIKSRKRMYLRLCNLIFQTLSKYDWISKMIRNFKNPIIIHEYFTIS